MDDLLVCYDFMLRGERAEGDVRRLQGMLGPILQKMDHEGREELFGAFQTRTREAGWMDEGILEFQDWLFRELGLESDRERF